MTKGNILIIDDEESLRSLLVQLLELEDYKVWGAENAKAAMDILAREEIHIVVSDVRLPDANGVELSASIKSRYPECEVIVLTAYGTIKDGVKAIKNGAFDYITKGDEDNKILPVIGKAMDKVLMRARIERLETQITERFSFSSIHGSSDAIRETVEMARRVSLTSVPVLLQGETGTGKEIFAQAIHYSGSRKDAPFVAVNCSALARELLESEMFGYKAGAFTGAVKNKKGLFEEANNGTLFLDEIGEMDIALQSKLLRVIETNTFIKQGDTKETSIDVRIIAATNRNLEEEIIKGNFRKDLYYRISVVKIDIPPLREHKDDIPLLTEQIIKEYAARLKRNIRNVTTGFMDALFSYDYPGNIRELKNILERAIILAEGDTLTEKYLPRDFHTGISAAVGTKNISADVSIDMNTGAKEPGGLLLLEDVEKQHIRHVLSLAGGNKTRAAEMMGIGLTTLYRKLQLYGLE